MLSNIRRQALENQRFFGLAAMLGRRPLSHQLALLVLATAVPLLFSSVLMFNLLAASERETIRQNLLVSAKTLAALVDNEIDTHAAIGWTLSHSPALQAGDLVAFWQEAKQALEFVPGAWLAVSNPEGQIVLNTLAPPGTPLPKHAAPDVIQRGFATRHPQIGDLVLGPVARRLTAFVEVPVFRDNAPIYSISISLVPARFLGLIKDQFTHGEVVGILDRNAKFVARVPDHERRVGTLASEGWRGAIERAPIGWTETPTLEGEFGFTGYTRTAHGWTTGVGQLESDIGRPARKILWLTALGAISLTLLSLALAVLIARHASRGMTALTLAVNDLREGRMISTPLAPFAEAGTIAKTLADASAELKRRGDLLARANSELEAKVAQRTEELSAQMKRREESETRLRQVQKMESIGQLTGGIAHDFNNMLTVIMGNLDTAQRRLKSLDNAATLNRPIEAALQGSRNAARLTQRLLAFSRQQALEPKRVDLNALIAGLSDMLARTVGEGIKVETVSSAGLWAMLADANQIESCLINLAVNARDAMPEGGRLTIETANVLLDETYVAGFGDLKAGQYVMLSVSDTGTGIAPETLEKVFEPFFTTKEPGKGTGLGLAMVHGFVKQSGGHIRIYSELGQGTAVKIYLPRLAEAGKMAAAPKGATVEALPVRLAIPGETILLVEDDIGVRDYASKILAIRF